MLDLNNGMEYKNFKNKHLGEKVIVCGCGVSAANLKNPESYYTIGVNDLGRLFTSNYLVVLNDIKSFKGDRWKYVAESKASHIFTHIKTLAVKEDQKVILQLGKYGSCDLNKDQVDYTGNSPYVACIIAAYMGFTKIGLLGVDFQRNHFFGETGEHSLNKKINVINKEYEHLRIAMKTKGIELVNLSPTSNITIPKQRLEDF